MQLLNAWQACGHGKAILNETTGKRIEKWMGEKPHLELALGRMIEDSPDMFTIEELMSGAWICEQENS